ncbi:hypothetical protein FUAX_53180 (plasmid) [Fulvitalea axinellae]|uniref:Uncharacterized protein n=1 Tax=Fulvitalea axinellae TaxID=1182444 RepID=A0AAU9CV03_9BACT|nr:hypothetical protein FUAX_53180 [Fulvitalea axinellae]
MDYKFIEPIIDSVFLKSYNELPNDYKETISNQWSNHIKYKYIYMNDGSGDIFLMSNTDCILIIRAFNIYNYDKFNTINEENKRILTKSMSCVLDSTYKILLKKGISEDEIFYWDTKRIWYDE